MPYGGWRWQRSDRALRSASPYASMLAPRDSPNRLSGAFQAACVAFDGPCDPQSARQLRGVWRWPPDPFAPAFGMRHQVGVLL